MGFGFVYREREPAKKSKIFRFVPHVLLSQFAAKLSVARRLSDGGNFAEFSLCASLTRISFKVLKVSQRPISANFKRRLPGDWLSLKGAAASKTVQYIWPSASMASISVGCKAVTCKAPLRWWQICRFSILGRP